MDRPSASMPAIRILCLLLSLALAFFLGGPSLLLAFVCETRVGLAFAIASFLLSTSPALILLSLWRRSSFVLRSLGAGGLAISIALFAWLATHAPDGHASHPETARVQNRYLGGAWRFQRYALGNLLPESDQFMLGLKFIPALDSLFTMKQARHMTRLTSTIYRELESDPEFHALGSVMPATYDELWGRDFNRGHYFLYIPANLGRHQPRPALVFLHGSGGNFKSYPWVLSKIADELGMILIVPSYGMGNWREPYTSRLISSCLKDAATVAALDPTQIHLMGLSNGGLAVSQAGAALGNEFRSLIFLSPVFDRAAVTSADFLKKWKARPVLIISGREDDRIPFPYVRENASWMTSAGIPVTLIPVEEADHFMIFSHREEVIRTITSWLRQQSGR